MPKPLPTDSDADPNGSPDRVLKSTISGHRAYANLFYGFFLGWYLCKNRFTLPKMAGSAANGKAQLRPGRITSHNENPSLVALGKNAGAT